LKICRRKSFISAHVGSNSTVLNFRVFLQEMPANQQQEGDGKDGANFVVLDEGGKFWEDIRKYDEIIEDAAVEVFEAFEIAENVF
jgi:hypothetical protein